jgi:elongation factor G
MKGHSAAAVGAVLARTAYASFGNGVVQWDIQRTQRQEEFARLGKRADTFEEVITNEQARGGYFSTCRLGTPGQDLTLQLDTGSSDIWVPDSDAQVCRTGRTASDGCALGTCMAPEPNPFFGNGPD